MTRRHAFTLIELLVVMTIIALLAGLTLPALSGARNQARAARVLSDMRQTLVAYASYHTDHNGHVLDGYTPTSVNGQLVTVRVANETLHGFPAQRYPLRLAGYQNDAWEFLYNHTQAPERPTTGDTTADVWLKAYNLGVNVSFGINATYVGGHLNEGGFGPMPYYAEQGTHVVWRAHQPKRTSELIVFGESLYRGGGVTSGDEGYHLLTPPFANGEQWRPDGDDFEIVNTSALIGLPQGRFVDGTATGFFDGHAARLKSQELYSSRLWANNADSETYDYQP